MSGAPGPQSVSNIPVSAEREAQKTISEREHEAWKSVKYDDEGVEFIMGGEVIKVPNISFFMLTKVWDEQAKAALATTSIDRIRATLTVCEILLSETDNPLTVEQMGRKLRGKEWPQLNASYARLLCESGLLEPSQVEATWEETPQGSAGGGGGGGESPTQPLLTPAVPEAGGSVNGSVPSPDVTAAVDQQEQTKEEISQQVPERLVPRTLQ